MRLPFFNKLLDRQFPVGLMSRSDITEHNENDDLLVLAEHINRALAGVNPSDHFVTQLRPQLLLAHQPSAYSWWGRIRGLPPRTQLAAAGIGGATLTAGVVLLISRFIPSALAFWRNRRAVTV